MLSRIFWIGLAIVALVAGIAFRSGHGFMSWDHDGDRSPGHGLESHVDAAIDSGVGRMEIVGPDGERIDVPPEAKREFARAISRLVKAETSLAMLRIRDGSQKEMAAATIRRDQAKGEVEALKAQIEKQKALSDARRNDLGEQIRADVRETVREAVRN